MASSGDDILSVGARTDSGKDVSALQANIEANGAHAYYYAHRKRDTGEEPAPPPVHVVLERVAVEPEEQIETLFTYQFCDEEQVVKVYVPLEEVGSRVDDASVTSSFQERSFELSVRGYKPGRVVLRLAVLELFGDIVPDACSHKKLANKVVLTLRKKDGENGGKAMRWSKLK